MERRCVFVTGGTGYIGRHLIPELVSRGHRVLALARAGSEKKLPPGCECVLGNALESRSFANRVAPADTYVQLVGVPHPSPAKARQFREIDLVSGLASVAAAREAKVQHFVYVSVAQPAPVMKEYQAVRAEVEVELRRSGLNATVLRSWYILGPGHWWPYALTPAYWLCERWPATRESALRLGLVTLRQMIAALVHAVENPANGLRLIGVPEIRHTVTPTAMD